MCVDDCEFSGPANGQNDGGTWSLTLLHGGPNISITTTDGDGTVRVYELDEVDWDSRNNGPCPGPVVTERIDIRNAESTS